MHVRSPRAWLPAPGRLDAVRRSREETPVLAALVVAFSLVLSFAAGVAQAAPTITELFGFPCSTTTGCPDGSNPGSLIQASDGNFYGTARSTVYKITASGQFTLLYTFKEDPTTGHFPNGEYPGSLVEGPDGFLYGVAGSGGQVLGLAVSQPGNLFKLSKTGSFSIVYTFCSAAKCADGALPNSIIVGKDGNFYGSTIGGGSFQGQNCQSFGCGVVFRLTPGGAYTVLHTLNGTTEGSRLVGLVQASDGNFYASATFANGAGATIFGGVLRVTTAGQTTVLYTFPSPQTPVSRLIQASNGLLYGAEYYFGQTVQAIYEISTTGAFRQVLQTTVNCCIKEGFTRVIEASDGNLWATNPNTQLWGTIYSATLTGTLLQTIAFSGTNGAAPTGLIQGSDGKLYGTTYNHGLDGSGQMATGAIFSVNAGLPAP
jgi:uncharacterized repeat protein (TIGR03803 family)